MFMQAHRQDTSHLYNKDSLLGDFRIFTFDTFLAQVPDCWSKFESIYVIRPQWITTSKISVAFQNMYFSLTGHVGYCQLLGATAFQSRAQAEREGPTWILPI